MRARLMTPRFPLPWLVVMLALVPAATATGDEGDGRAPDSIVTVTDVVFATAPAADGRPVALTMDAAFPRRSGNRALPAVIYIHGGGYFTGSKEHGEGFIRALARGGYFAASIEYRLADVAPYPAAVHDCKAAVRFLRAHAEDLVIDPSRIAVCGHSAGGHLSALLAVTGDEPSLEGEVGPRGVSSAVACAVDISGPTDFTAPAGGQARRIIANWFRRRGDELRAAQTAATPMTWADGDDPPILIVHGARDRLVPVRHATALDAALRAAGAPTRLLRLPEQGHLVTDPKAYRAMAEFLDEHLGGDATSEVDRLTKSGKPGTVTGFGDDSP